MVGEHVDVVLQGEPARRVGRELQDAHLDHDQQGEQEEHDQQRDRREQDAERTAARRRALPARRDRRWPGAVTVVHLRLALRDPAGGISVTAMAPAPPRDRSSRIAR